jgi:nucleotide-binding universal stress UspA family protein
MSTQEEQTIKEPIPPACLPLEVRHILVPLDFSGASRQALDYAVPFAQEFGAKITLVHVIPPQVYYPLGVKLYEEAEVFEAAKKTLASRAAELVPPELLRETALCRGHPYEEIVRLAQETDADLIIMTTHGHAGVARIFLGSTAERVIRHAPCPVLAVRRRRGDRRVAAPAEPNHLKPRAG